MPRKKNQRFHRRAIKSRFSVSSSGLVLLSVYRSNQHICASLVEPSTRRTLTSISSRGLQEKESISSLAKASHKRFIDSAAVGAAIAKKATNLGIQKVAFDRSGYAYHGRVKALADAAREAGLQF